ncbi:rCG23686 [Rattus norvegicus]|uniref:RCG23686 n=1 Tax=Rattus norvegicus TaxID=10116 RepID=A6KJR6_RAT|nr:rCG23686 [Rattus norvegicus]
MDLTVVMVTEVITTSPGKPLWEAACCTQWMVKPFRHSIEKYTKDRSHTSF